MFFLSSWKASCTIFVLHEAALNKNRRTASDTWHWAEHAHCSMAEYYVKASRRTGQSEMESRMHEIFPRLPDELSTRIISSDSVAPLLSLSFLEKANRPQIKRLLETLFEEFCDCKFNENERISFIFKRKHVSLVVKQVRSSPQLGEWWTRSLWKTSCPEETRWSKLLFAVKWDLVQNNELEITKSSKLFNCKFMCIFVTCMLILCSEVISTAESAPLRWSLPLYITELNKTCWKKLQVYKMSFGTIPTSSLVFSNCCKETLVSWIRSNLLKE